MLLNVGVITFNVKGLVNPLIGIAVGDCITFGKID